ncbi:GroEL-like equatorial domain superfamily [Sesbania bispinosa]|nr:GroEL-like equatorial domain superfamily [Sesbania bispinosa]
MSLSLPAPSLSFSPSTSLYRANPATIVPLIVRLSLSPRAFLPVPLSVSPPSVPLSVSPPSLSLPLHFAKQPQIILLKEGTETSQGKAQLVSNINTCTAIPDVFRTTLGPRGMEVVQANGIVLDILKTLHKDNLAMI